MLGGCGYRFDGANYHEESISLTIPYIDGDPDGLLTDELIRQFSASGLFDCVREGGQYILNVKVLEDVTNRIGYRYDRNDSTGQLKKNVIPDEYRRSLKAQVSFVRSCSDEIFFGPEIVSASSEYDCVNPSVLSDLTFINPAGVREKVIKFSLGQLDSMEGAQDNAAVPLYRQLAQTIVDGISNVAEYNSL